MSIDDSTKPIYYLKPPVVDTIFYACGCLSKDDQTIYCAVHRSLRVPELDPVQDLIARLRGTAKQFLTHDEEAWVRFVTTAGTSYSTKSLHLAGLLNEAADLLENR